MEFNSYEYTIEQRAEGKWLFYKAVLVLLYFVYTAVYLFLIIKFAFVPLGALIPVTLWIIVFFTWRYTKPDYRYSVESGNLTFTVIYGGRTKKEKFRTHIADSKIIAPISEFDALTKNIKIYKIYNAVPSRLEKDVYGILFEKESKACIFLFKATRDSIKILHYYNKSTIISETKY